MEISGRRKEKDGDDHNTDILCDPCLGVNEEENAVFYCTVCDEFLCDVDAKKHRKAAISKAHQLLDRNNMPRHKSGSHEDTICLLHSGEVLGYYCNSHSKSCCTVCVIKEHKQCEVEYIDDISKGYEQGSEYKSLIKNIADLTRRLHSAKQQSLDNQNNAKRLQSEIVSEIRKFRQEINSILDSLENASLKESKGALNVHSDAAGSTSTNCDMFIAKLNEMASSIENIRKYKQERSLVIHSKNARVQIKDIEDKLPQSTGLNITKNYKFVPDDTIAQLFRSLKSLGHLEITEERKKLEENDQRSRNSHNAEVSVRVVNQLVKATHVRDINIQHSTDTSTRCWITGGVMVDKNNLALADHYNNNVKVVDVTSNTVTTCIKLPSAPWDITRVEQDQVVVRCGRGKLVFLKVGESFSIVKQLDIDGYVRGIAYTNNSFLVGFGYPDPCVEWVDFSGKTLKTFRTDAAGNNLFDDPEYIALSEDQSTIFVSDPGNNSVTSLCIDGTVQGVYTDNNLRYPRGLAVDKNDNVYVAGYESHNIHQLSTDCKLIQVLLDTKHGIKCSWMVTYCKIEHKLYIGYHLVSGKNYISVFQLQ